MQKITNRKGVSSMVAGVLLVIGLIIGGGAVYAITPAGKTTTATQTIATTVAGSGSTITQTVGGSGATITQTVATTVTASASSIAAGTCSVRDANNIAGASSSSSSATSTTPVKASGPALSGAVTIGVMTDLSSTLSSIGQRIKFSTQQAVTDINAWLQTTQWAGKVTFKVDVEDYAQDNTKATNIVNAWNSEGVTTFTGPLNSGTAGAILSLVDGDQMVMISPSSTSYALAQPNDYLFRTAPTDNIQGAADACMMISNGVKGVIQVYRQDTYGSGLANFTAAAFKADGGTVLASIPYDPTTTNFGPVVSAISSAWTAAMSTPGMNSGNVAIQAITFEEIGPLLLAAQQNAPAILKTTQPWYGTDGQEGDSVITNSTYAPEVAQIRLAASIFGYTNSSKTAALCSEMLAATNLACGIRTPWVRMMTYGSSLFLCLTAVSIAEHVSSKCFQQSQTTTTESPDGRHLTQRETEPHPTTKYGVSYQELVVAQTTGITADLGTTSQIPSHGYLDKHHQCRGIPAAFLGCSPSFFFYSLFLFFVIT